jgi:hypothetical protein
VGFGSVISRENSEGNMAGKQSRYIVGGVIVILFVTCIGGCGKKQEVIFEVQTYSWKNRDAWQKSQIAEECDALSKELKGYLDKGWRVVASSPKEKLVVNSVGTCTGTEYVLEK